MNQEETRPRTAAMFVSFLRLGLTAFGGPAIVPYIRILAVEKRRWLSESAFARGVALCQSIPGTTAMQMAAYTGLVARGPGAAVACFVGLGLPTFVLMMALAAAYERYGGVGAVAATMGGLKVVVVALIAFASLDFARKTVRKARDAALALATAAYLVAGGNPALAIAAAMVIGALVYRDRPLRAVTPDDPATRMGAWRRIRPAAVAAAALGLGLSSVALLLPDLLPLAALMSKVGAVAFGGGYGLVPLLLHEVVTVHAWMSTETLMDGIALGQVTPGPIFITATFIGYHLHGFTGAVVATAAIFTPPLVILLATARYLDTLERSAAVQRALHGALVSFAGLLTATTVLFALAAPWSTVSAVLAGVSFAALFFGVDPLWVVLAGGALSALLL
ncbi:MAG: chromate efflux transporter [Thermoleophilia bacterium]